MGRSPRVGCCHPTSAMGRLGVMRSVILFAVQAVVPLVVLLVVVLVVRGRNAAAAPAPLATQWAAGGPLVWNAVVLDGSLQGRAGRFTLEAGHLNWWPEAGQAPLWTVPVNQIAAATGPLIGVATVNLSGPMGQVACTVSTEHINRFAQNTLKTMRERGYARDFVAALAAHGAHALPQ